MVIMNIAIIVPRWVSRPFDYYAFPLGLAYISAVLKRDGHRVNICNCNHRAEPLDILLRAFITDNVPDIICTGGLSVHFSGIRQIITTVTAIAPDATTILGGGVISSDPELIFSTIAPDIGVIGEGERTISELVHALMHHTPLDAISGIIYRDSNGASVTTAPRDPITDLDSLPWPDYEGFDVATQLEAMLPTDENYLHMHDTPRMLPMISSRSCPFSCTFCFHPLGNKYRERSLDNFFSELDYLVTTYRLNSVMILDELFAVKRDRLNEFCRRIKPYAVTWIVQLRVDTVDSDLLAAMKDAGCVFISYGIESMSDTVLESMKKKTSHAVIEHALNLTAKAGIGIQGNLLFGDKEETAQTMAESLIWWSQHREHQVNLTPIYAYPGTELYHDACKKGLITDKVAFLERCCPPLNVTTMDDAVFTEMIRTVETLHETVATSLLTSVYNVHLLPGRSRLRNDPLIEFETTCPNCKEHLTYRNIPVGKNPMARFTLRMACKACNIRFDMALSLRLEKPDPQELHTMLSQAEKLATEARFTEALKLLSETLKRFPANDQVMAFTGRIMVQLGNINDAIYWLSLAVRINPLSAATQASLATALSQKRNYIGAHLHMQEAWKLSAIEADATKRASLHLFKLHAN